MLLLVARYLEAVDELSAVLQTGSAETTHTTHYGPLKRLSDPGRLFRELKVVRGERVLDVAREFIDERGAQHCVVVRVHGHDF